MLWVSRLYWGRKDSMKMFVTIEFFEIHPVPIVAPWTSFIPSTHGHSSKGSFRFVKVPNLMRRLVGHEILPKDCFERLLKYVKERPKSQTMQFHGYRGVVQFVLFPSCLQGIPNQNSRSMEVQHPACHRLHKLKIWKIWQALWSSFGGMWGGLGILGRSCVCQD